MAEPKAKLNAWHDVVIEFPIDYKVESFEWSGEKELAIEYSKGSSEFSLREYRPDVLGVRVTLREKDGT